ncbi:IS5 family transposase [Methylobacterium sp. J-059]|nr:IS5 family transposase [Methylobacterium sp. J-059]MCJ2042708.1 IS5 family transposase [Methylobacterium sp. J-059]
MPSVCKGKRGPRTDNRLFLDAVVWMTRAGGRWKNLPERFGKVETVKRRYYDWMARGVLSDILAVLAAEADLEWVCVDATVVRAHQQAAGARWEKGAPDAQGLGRSRGGLSTKIQLACDALGNPVRVLAGPGQQGEVLRAAELIEGLACSHVIADRAYDAEQFHDTVLDAGAQPVIPSRPKRRRPHTYDRHLYKKRNLIERCFAKLKQFRRLATRYDKLLVNFVGFLTLAATLI